MNPVDVLVGFLEWGIDPSQGLYLHREAQHRTTRAVIHASSGIGAHDPSLQAAQESTCLRPRGSWDQLTSQYDGEFDHFFIHSFSSSL